MGHIKWPSSFYAFCFYVLVVVYSGEIKWSLKSVFAPAERQNWKCFSPLSNFQAAMIFFVLLFEWRKPARVRRNHIIPRDQIHIAPVSKISKEGERFTWRGKKTRAEWEHGREKEGVDWRNEIAVWKEERRFLIFHLLAEHNWIMNHEPPPFWLDYTISFTLSQSTLLHP